MAIEYLAGTHEIQKKVLPPFADCVCAFLDNLSRSIRKDVEAQQYTDLQTFAFWCRKANISKLRQQYEEGNQQIRIGKGIVFHIAPSNVPINAGFTYVFGLLSGDANVVRISRKKHAQVLCLCRILNQLFANEEYWEIRDMTSFVTYEPNKEVNDYYSSICAMRIVWGGDKTIEEIRKSPLPPRSTEVTFADRYSFGVMDANAIAHASDEQMKRLAKDFYNDTYLMDQNACSSPHMIFWLNAKDEVKRRFWDAVYEAAHDYDLVEQKVSDKYTRLCEAAATYPEIIGVQKYENYLYVATLDESKMCKDMAHAYRGIYGMFFETDIRKINQVLDFVDERVQTCAIFGVDEKVVREEIMTNACQGIDRVVPFGQTLDIGVFWDGYDIVRSLSRIIG